VAIKITYKAYITYITITFIIKSLEEGRGVGWVGRVGTSSIIEGFYKKEMSI